MFDFKKEQKDLYNPKNEPHFINVPEMNFIAVKGKGNPNDLLTPSSIVLTYIVITISISIFAFNKNMNK